VSFELRDDTNRSRFHESVKSNQAVFPLAKGFQSPVMQVWAIELLFIYNQELKS
jgi:hypothetical protein